MSDDDIDTLRTLLAQANKSIRELERKYSELAHAAASVLEWAEYDGARYTVGRLPIDDLRAALKRLQASQPKE